MMFIYKTAKFAPVWTTVLKIWAIFVHRASTEHALSRKLNKDTDVKMRGNFQYLGRF